MLQRALEDFRVTYELNAYCEDPERMYPLYSELHRNIQDVFNEHGVQIMTPAYVTDPEEPKIVPQNRWYEPPARTAAGDNPTSEAAPTGSAPSPRGRRRANQLPES